MLLQVVILPSPGDEIAQILSSIGGSIPQIFNREGLERQRLQDQIAADPAMGQRIASQVRAASAEGALDDEHPGLSSVGETLGLDMNNQDSLALLASIEQTFPSTMEEQLGALASGATVGAAAGPTAQLTHETLTAKLKEEKQVSATTALASLGEQQRLEFLQTANFSRLAGQYDIITTRLGIEDANQKLSAWKALDAFITANPDLAGQEAAGLVNPQFLDYLSLMASLSLEEQLAYLRANTDGLTAMEAIGAVISLGQERNKLWNSIREAKKNDASDEEITALNAQWNDVEATGQLLADQVPGLRWSTIALPGQERDPIVYSPPEKWTEYTTSFLEAGQAQALDTAYGQVIAYAGGELGHLVPGSLEWMAARGVVIRDIQARFPEFWEHLVKSEGVGEFYAEINAWVAAQGGVQRVETGEVTTPPTPEEIAEAQEMVRRGQAKTVSDALKAIGRGVKGAAKAILEQSKKTTPASPTGRQ